MTASHVAFVALGSLAFVGLLLLLSIVLPGPVYEGRARPDGAPRRYRVNGLAVFAVTAVIVASMTLAGLIYAGLWAFAPLAVADIAATAVVAVALAITIGYAGTALQACRAKRTSPS